MRYQVSATTRFREYFSPSITSDPANLTRTSPEVEIDVLSSARSGAPRVLYAVPTFGWQQSADNGTLTSTRRGGGVRVYLGRSWWSSGEGELLGVVLGSSVPIGAMRLYRFSTFWGQDPLGSRRASLAARDELPQQRRRLQNRRSWRSSGQIVTVVGFEVHWDADRKLWYADLELDTAEAYFPIVRLALVRYQPNSLFERNEYDPGTWLDLRASTVVLTDLVQTVPIERSRSRATRCRGVYTVAVSGVTYRAQRSVFNDVIAVTSQVEARLQRRRRGVEDDVLAWTDLPVAVDLRRRPRRQRSRRLAGAAQRTRGAPGRDPPTPDSGVRSARSSLRPRHSRSTRSPRRLRRHAPAVEWPAWDAPCSRFTSTGQVGRRPRVHATARG